MMIALLEFFGRIWQGSDDKKRISPPRRRTKKDGEQVTRRSESARPVARSPALPVASAIISDQNTDVSGSWVFAAFRLVS